MHYPTPLSSQVTRFTSENARGEVRDPFFPDAAATQLGQEAPRLPTRVTAGSLRRGLCDQLGVWWARAKA